MPKKEGVGECLCPCRNPKCSRPRSSRSEEEMRRAHRARHVGTRVLCTVLPPRARRSRSQIDNRILPREIKETVLRSAPVSGKSLGPLLPHPSVDSLHRLVTSQMSPCTMGTQHKKVSVAHSHALRLHRGSVKRTAQRKHVHSTSSSTSRGRDCASALTRYRGRPDPASS